MIFEIRRQSYAPKQVNSAGEWDGQGGEAVLERKQAAHRSQCTDDPSPKNNKKESQETQTPKQRHSVCRRRKQTQELASYQALGKVGEGTGFQMGTGDSAFQSYT